MYQIFRQRIGNVNDNIQTIIITLQLSESRTFIFRSFQQHTSIQFPVPCKHRPKTINTNREVYTAFATRLRRTIRMYIYYRIKKLLEINKAVRHEQKGYSIRRNIYEWHLLCQILQPFERIDCLILFSLKSYYFFYT